MTEYVPELYEISNEEELDEVEYLQILSLDEMIKDNPSFIAFSREEIFNELFMFFKQTNKADMVSDMFFRHSNKTDIRDFVFVGDVSFRFPEEIDDFLKEMKALTKMQYQTSQKGKNKLWSILSYDSDSKRLKLKPYTKTTIEVLHKSFNVYYPISNEDNVYIPIMACYFKRPVCSTKDYLSQKVLAFMDKPELLNNTYTQSFIDVQALLDAVNPKVQQIIDSVQFNIEKENFNMDYNNIEAIFAMFNSSFDDINLQDFELVKKHLDTHIANIKPDVISYKKYSQKKLIGFQNEKLDFYSKLESILNLIDVSDKKKEDYERLISLLKEERINLNVVPLLYNNISDIINATVNNDIPLEQIIENISLNRERIIIDNLIVTLNDFLKYNQENIRNKISLASSRFTNIKDKFHDLFHLNFIDLYSDIEEIKLGNNQDVYDGIPYNYNSFEGNPEMNEDVYHEFDIDIVRPTTVIEKYWLALKFKNEKGFVEMLRIVLPMLQKVENVSKLSLDYDGLCNTLYTKFSSIPTKTHIITENFKKHGVNVDIEDIMNLAKISPNVVLNINFDKGKDIKESNLQFLDIIYSVCFHSLAWWSLRIQQEIINDTLMFDENAIQIDYLDKWSVDGLPIKDSNDGVLVYLATIFEDVMKDVELYKVAPDIISNTMKMINSTFSEEIQKIKSDSIKIKKKINKGDTSRQTLKDRITEMNSDRKKINKVYFEKLLIEYIDALIYMPSYKFKKNHKFLLGCCIQKIGEDFIPYSDFTLSKRTDLLSAKQSYAKKRKTNNSSYPLYYIPKKEKDIEHSDVFRLPTIQKKEETKVETWLENMKEVSPLLPNNIISFLQNGSKDEVRLSVSYIQMLTKTSGHGSKTDLKDKIFGHYINHTNILIILSSLFEKMASELENVNEKELVSSARICISSFLINLKDLSKLSEEYNTKTIRRIKDYILTRALCLPFNPDISNNDILKPSIDVSNGFVSLITKKIYNTVLTYLNNIGMPTQEENTDFVNKIRETYKNKTLSRMNKLSQDERSVYDQLKKIGFKYEDDEVQTDVNINAETDYEQEGEKEFAMVGEDVQDDDYFD